MNRNCRFIASIALAVAFILPTLTSSAAESRVAITIDAAHPGPAVAQDFSGLSFEVSVLLPNENGVRYFRSDNAPLIRLFHTLGIKSLRIGGNTSDRDVRKLPDNADLDSLFGFAKAAEVMVIYCLQLRNGDAQADAATVKYILSRYAAQMDSFSIGQEPSAYPVEKKDTRAPGERMGAANEKFQYSDYAAAWKKFADAIVAENPDVRFCGPSVHNNGVWAQKFIADFGRSNHVSLITEHLYPGGAGGKVPTPEIGRDPMLSDDFVARYQKLYDSFAPLAVTNGLPYRLEEVNNYFNGGATNVSNTFASALWGLDFMYWWAAHGTAGVNFHTGDRVAAGYTLQPSKYTAFFSTTNGYLIRPLGYGITAFHLGAQGRLVPVTISNADHVNLSAYAVLGDDNNFYLTVINKEHGSTARAAKISVAAGGIKFLKAQSISLIVPDGDVAATSGETLGGATIQKDGRWEGNWNAVDDISEITVSSASAVIIKFSAD